MDEGYSTKLDLFAREFDSEDKLRKVLSDLFRKMECTGVRITHGPNEKGKDVIFSAIGPLGERRLFACVVKNSPITGQADDLKNGAPTIVARIQGVVNQVNSAFDEPIPNGKGSDERIDSVYVISPYECSISTIESVKNAIQRSGQVEFKCGQGLLELFAQYWPEFLWFQSSVLTSYLSALRKGLEEDYALANLILRKAFLENSPGGLLDRYVEPTFHCELTPRSRIELIAPNLRLLDGPRSYSDVGQEMRTAKLVEHILGTAPFWLDEDRLNDAKKVEQDLAAIASQIQQLWDDAYQRHIARILDEVHRSKSRRNSQGFAKSRYGSDAGLAPPKSEVSVELNPSVQFVTQATELADDVKTLLSRLCSVVEEANGFAQANHSNPIAALGTSEFLSYSRISDMTRIVPFAFESSGSCGTLEFGENLLDEFAGSILITGPPGLGKTTFCRWHAIADANRLVDKQNTILPVYVPLHPLSAGKLGSFRDTFFRPEELQKLLVLQSAGQSPFKRIRLYLDGLDEVTSLDRQKEIMELAGEGARQLNFLQVVVTGRDHVGGPWLRWLPRVRLSPLSERKIRELTTKWLGADRVDAFFSRLTEAENLRALMSIPLLGTLILAVYRKTGNVPPNKTALYSLFVELLCGGWDVYKNIQRRDNQFSLRDKAVVLTRLAGILQMQSKRDASTLDFRTAIKNSLPSFLNDCDQLMNEIVEDGLLIRSGSLLNFSHLSFQEFLAARDLQDPTGNRPKLAMSRYFSGEDWWKEVLAFYVTMCERPAEMDEWIPKRALASTSKITDLEERVLYLKKSLHSAFPAYNEHHAARQLLERLKVKANRLTGKGDLQSKLNVA